MRGCARAAGRRLANFVSPLNVMSIASALTDLCDILRTNTNADVILGRPEDSTSAIYIWPWRLDVVREPASRPSPASPGESGAHQTPAQNLHFLVLATPALNIEGLSRLDQARQVILGNPVLTSGGVNVQLVLENALDVEQLTSVFLASEISLTLCLSGVMRGVR